MNRLTDSPDTRSATPDDLLDSTRLALEDGLLPVEIFADPQVFEAEMDRIFTRSWVFVGFESEIPAPGDFVVRRIGKDSVIVARARDRKINVLLNHCRHRGAQLCANDRGNTSHFRCPYHGWVYKNTGEWHGAPDRGNAYPNLDTKAWGLLKAPHVDTLFGLIFACLSPDAPPLLDYLGGAAWMMKVIMDLHPDSMSVMGPPDRYRIRANWKSASENFAGDTYHVGIAHRSVEKINLGRFELANQVTTNHILDNGHCFIGAAMEAMIGEAGQLWGYPRAIREKFDLSRLDEAQRAMALHRAPTIGNIFPNLSFIRLFNLPEPGKEPTVYTSWRQWYPISPTETEALSWQLKWNFMSAEEAAECYSAGQFSFSAAGIFEQDDTVLWEGAPKVAQSPWARKHKLAFNLQLGMESLGGAQKRDSTWAGPGTAYHPGPGESSGRAFYTHWLNEMQRNR
jgi:phenylpropionate dioxygenase-like ring-hydroxylating dioxygenase large terminal subunit